MEDTFLLLSSLFFLLVQIVQVVFFPYLDILVYFHVFTASEIY